MQIVSQNTTAPSLSAEMVNSFISFLQAKPKTIETYTRALKQFFAYMSERQLTKPAKIDIIGYCNHLKARQHKPATIQSYFVAVKRFFSWLAEEGLYSNIAENVKSGVKQDRDFKKTYLTSDQVKQVMKAIDTTSLTGKRDYAIMAIMLTSGLRTIEITRLDHGDMRQLGTDNLLLYVQGKGKDTKSDFVKVVPPVKKAIDSYLKARGKADAASPLFTSTSNNSNGERMTTRSISGIVKARLVAAGYNSEYLTAHSLRHTAATINLLSGGSLEETKQLLRHADINTTMIYAHHLDRMKNNSEQRIAAAIF
jgi:integrase/recombinase XerC